jgi:hypothetical protein
MAIVPRTEGSSFSMRQIRWVLRARICTLGSPTVR